jgi:hypothetical protein
MLGRSLVHGHHGAGGGPGCDYGEELPLNVAQRVRAAAALD